MSPDEPAVLYIALSRKLANWADSHARGYPFKIGTGRTAEGREETLALGYKGKPNCFGCKDWVIRPVDAWPFATRAEAQATEKMFKRYVGYLNQPKRNDVPWTFRDGAHGESDVYLVQEHQIATFGKSSEIRTPLLKEVLRRVRWRLIQLRNELHPELDADEFEGAYIPGADDLSDPDYYVIDDEDDYYRQPDDNDDDEDTNGSHPDDDDPDDES